jgi:AGCS family alanine or glycine:cation symporter
VFSTLLGWSYFGEKACEYLFGARAVRPYRWCWVGAVFLGSVLPLAVVWAAAAVTKALMTILLLLSGVVVRETRTYLWGRPPRRRGRPAERRRTVIVQRRTPSPPGDRLVS